MFPCGHSLWTELLFCKKIVAAWMTWKQGTSPQTASVKCTMEKSILGPSNAARTWGAQHLKGYKIYSESMFLFLFYLVQLALSLSHLLLHLSFWDPEKKLHSLSPPAPPLAVHHWILRFCSLFTDSHLRPCLHLELLWRSFFWELIRKSMFFSQGQK